jgi:putative membrane protein
VKNAHAWRHHFLNSDAESRVESRIQDFEKKTGAELKIAILKASSPYRAAFWRATALGGFVAACFFYELHALEGMLGHAPEILLTQWAFFIGFPAVSFAFGALSKIYVLRRLFISEAEVQEETRENALTLFHRLKLSETSHRSGILMQISLLEHDLELLLDQGVARVTTAEKLELWIRGMSSEFKQGHFERGILNCIESLEKEILGSDLSLPKLTGNEITNHLYWGEG